MDLISWITRAVQRRLDDDLRENMKMKLAKKIRGAALVEYAILLGLIGVMSIYSVSSLGGQVAEGFETTAEEIALDTLLTPTPETPVTPPSPWGDPLPEQELTSWTVSVDSDLMGDSAMPGHITNTGSKWGWEIDLYEVMQRRPVGSTVYWEASYSTSGRVTPRNSYANGFLNYGVESHWVRPGTDYYIMGGQAQPLTTPTDAPGVTTEYLYDGYASGGTVPSDATGIRLGRSFYACGYQSDCETDPVRFQIRIYVE